VVEHISPGSQAISLLVKEVFPDDEKPTNVRS
jgi:hypothetical protein